MSNVEYFDALAELDAARAVQNVEAKEQLRIDAADRKARDAERNARQTALSQPITPERIATFAEHLIAVTFEGIEECWLYAKGSGLDPTLKTTRYSTMTFNGERGVQVHRFALAASLGVTIADLDGYDVHHRSTIGRCLGYQCCNATHLQRLPHREHGGKQGKKGSLVRYQIKLMESAISLPYSKRHPVKGVVRTLGGVEFKIRRGVVDWIIPPDGDCLQDWTTPTFVVIEQ